MADVTDRNVESLTFALRDAQQGLRDVEARLRQSEERYDIAMRAVNEGVYDWNIADGTIHYSERVYAAVGMTPEVMRTPEDWRARIHPEDVPRYDAVLVDHFKGRTERFECDFRFRTLSDGWRWARQHGIAIRNGDGRTLRMIGSTGDITELKRTEEALRQSEERYALAASVATEGIYEWHVETGELYLSDGARNFWGFPSGPLTNTEWVTHIHPEDRAGYREAVIEHFKGATPILEHEMRARDAHGEYRWVHDRGIAVRDRDGRAIKLVGATSDVTQRRRAEEALRRAHDETTEALEQQTATAEILKVIGSSPTDTAPVFDAIVRNLMRLFGVRFAVIQLLRDGIVSMPAVGGAAGFEKLIERYPRPLDTDTGGGEAMIRRLTVQYSPVVDNPAAPAATRQFARDFGFDSVIFAPMVRDGTVLGVIGIAHHAPKVYDDRQVTLIQAFADQAVIAIENVRLFNETKEALERQTATAEILKVISASPTDAQPVFDAIVKSCVRLFDGMDVSLNIARGDMNDRVALAMSPLVKDGAADLFPMPLTEQSISGRAMLTGELVHVFEVETESWFGEHGRTVCRRMGYRSALCAPMMCEGKGVGAITVFRRAPGWFKDDQISLLKTFADQAVIAIENVSLFKILEARTESLTRSVGQLTALGEVGQAISSTLDLQTVLKTIVARAVQISGQDAGVIYEYDETTEAFLLRAAENFDEQSVAGFRAAEIRKGTGAVGACVITREPTQVPDTHVPEYPIGLRKILDAAGLRAILAVPLLREEQIIGALLVFHKAPGPFGAEVVELLNTFASQSALAIQNARLFREIAEKGRELEVASRHKSDFLASMSHELRTPLNAILGFIELILGEVYGEVPADMQEPLTDIQASGKHLLRLINNVLDLAKIEAGRMELALSDYSVHDTVESVRQTLKALAAEKGVEFLATLPDDLPLAYGDPGRLTQCLMNLAGNSLKFTKTGSVKISVELAGDALVYRVADTGIGIPADKLDSLFTEFKQTDATIASEYGGTGLGLSISKKFVEMHGGRIWVESEIGRGSTFIFEVPLRADAEVSQ